LSVISIIYNIKIASRSLVKASNSYQDRPERYEDGKHTPPENISRKNGMTQSTGDEPRIFDGHNDSLMVLPGTSRSFLERSNTGNFDIPRAFEGRFGGGTISAILHFEGAEAIEKNLGNLDYYYDKGLRSLGLVWSRPHDDFGNWFRVLRGTLLSRWSLGICPPHLIAAISPGASVAENRRRPC
jgi:hypothetical protein